MFGRKKKRENEQPQQSEQPAVDAAATPGTAETPAEPVFDPINGDFGPFDADSVDYRAFDFSDFAKGGLDLGSVLVPVPHEAEVQVEMNEQGPQMIHVVTPFGRVTPVAFAAPRNGDLWSEAVEEIIQGMTNDGMTVSQEEGPWGPEVVADAGNGTMRVIGANGPRWMFRLTLAGPTDRAAELAELARGIISRTFVRRGQDPIPAGNSLPIQMPEAMAEELAKHMQERAQNAEAAQNPTHEGPSDQ
ncbi:DUF3710 domain-containing protein [Corynebacterium sp. 320]|uniref:DUF3710 domain-containing protein n=1 Tax=Corynebacterium TaxID=1716 RepID=UPI00125CA97D|nr:MULTISPECIES: DUF3710 domain-containing protein [Corynebacterium]KAB1503740.1 DUF3710 domain-containing protein [Corynebacterium sp. 320]KAB1553160.1 DUF3710 domain-containing protein [Corynebacterium sp. 321]KAB1553622.1 DUF3710 domain-containing protein [Corynebacterium sp. 319]KAB3527876.1 DUF3710 domain-containing protein [Corynebacterium sp. 250]KAB3540635.1 DUF3710 domain-containing protein [Corynebacterium sp. 366]